MVEWLASHAPRRPAQTALALDGNGRSNTNGSKSRQKEAIMYSARVGKKPIAIMKPMCILPVFLLAAFSLLINTSLLWAASFSQTKIIIEVNATAEDAGIQIFVDAEGWNRLEVFDPKGQKIVDVTGSNSVRKQGVTELFFESAEPSFEEQSLEELFALFPAGSYTFRGTTVDGQPLNGKAQLSHAIPAGPQIVSPAEGTVLAPNNPVVIDWNAVTTPFPGTTSPIKIRGYQIIVEQVKPEPLRIFSVNVPAAVTSVTVSPEFIQANAEYNFEVLTIDAGGNQTISEGSFTTAKSGNGSARSQRAKRVKKPS
jgi:hypothetical protein